MNTKAAGTTPESDSSLGGTQDDPGGACKMQPLSLEQIQSAAEAGLSLITREGELVRVLAHVPELYDGQIIGLIRDRDGVHLVQWYENGRPDYYSDCDSGLDLVAVAHDQD